jgi:oligoendopeptidase F
MTTYFRVARFLLLLILSVAVSAAADDGKVRERNEIEDIYKWRVEDIYPSDSVWENTFEYLKNAYPELETYRGRLGESAATLLECLTLRDSLELISDNLYVYAYLKLDEDNRVSQYQEMGGRISQLWSKVSEAMAYIEPEIVDIGRAKLMGFMDQAAGLADYRHYFDNLFRKQEHILSDREEALLALAGPAVNAPGNIFTMTNDADVDYGTILDTTGSEIHLTKERYYKILESPNRDFRRRANQQYNKTYLKYENTLAATLAASVKKDWFMAQARGYNTCLEMSLDQYNIPTDVFYSLIDAVNANLEPMHKWTAIRKRMLGYDTLYTYDLSAPVLPDIDREYTYEEARALVLKGLKPMGSQYLTDLEKGLNSGWIDVYETPGKGSGAYSWGTYSSHPYILLNYNKTMSAVFTLAHESGHAMHSFYTNRTEPYISHNHSLFAAEVASTGNEAVLMKYLLDNTDDPQLKLALLNQYIEQIQGTFFTQVMFSEFELAIHKHVEEGGALSADFMRQTYRDIYQKYWGSDLVIDSINDMGCLRIGHFYRQYYVYQYATSYAAAQMMSQKIMEDPAYIDTYLKFLSTGDSDYPVQVLKQAGVDVTSPEPVERTIQLFSDLVDQMEELLKEINTSAK